MAKEYYDEEALTHAKFTHKYFRKQQLERFLKHWEDGGDTSNFTNNPAEYSTLYALDALDRMIHLHEATLIKKPAKKIRFFRK